MPAAVRVEGIAELNRAFRRMSVELRTELRKGLAEAAEPVRAAAEGLAVANIRKIGERWSRMRVGVTPGLVYVAPRARRRGGSPRPNLGGLLMSRSMQPALDDNQEKVVSLLDAMLGRLGDDNGF